MGADINFYCDFNSGLIGEWEFKQDNILSKTFTLKTEKEIVVGIAANAEAVFDEYLLDGKTYDSSWSVSQTAYLSELGLMKAFRHTLSKGKHDININCHFNKDLRGGKWPAIVKLYILDIGAAFKSTDIQEDKICKYPYTAESTNIHQELDLSAYKKGVGPENPAIGRFGFTKGDGLLDCAMTTLGGINRMYLFGHPDYKKTTRWQYSALPAGIEPDKCFHGSFPPAQVGVEKDKISINYLSVNWRTLFPKKDGGTVKFACTYSLASAGIMVETDDCKLSLSELEYAGNYTRIMMPLENALTVRDISNDNNIYERGRDGEFKENWFLLFGANAFPDIPIQVVMTKKPEAINLSRFNGLLSGIEVHTNKKFGTGFLVSPFGIESFKPGETLKDDFINDAYKRSSFWSKSVLAYPVDAEEFYKFDDKNERIEIVQKFKYKIIKDEWKTKALKTAPLPPVLSIINGNNIAVLDSENIDFKFPTKYGHLRGVTGRDFSSYTIPYMPRERKFPLKDNTDKTISNLLSEDLKEYFEYHERFKSSEQATPFSGACTESYAWTSTLGNYMNEDDRAKMARKTSERLTLACKLYHEYIYPIVDHGDFMGTPPDTKRVIEIYSKPDIKKIKLHNWYQRKEPFSGLKYRICYLNVCMFYNGDIKDGSREEILNFKKPLIENDWGIGVGFYAMYLSALASGNFEPVRKNWKTLCEGFKYFETYHDWACMGSAYAENSASWVEGAGYGAFTSFVNMAEAVGDKDAYERGLYISSKYLALRLAVFRSSYTYFYRYFNHEPWFITKFFHDEAHPLGAFQNVPVLWGGKYRCQGIFNLTTEGFFPETFMMLQKFFPDDLLYLRDLGMRIYGEGKMKDVEWVMQQENSSCLLAAAVNENFDEKRFLDEIEEVEKRNMLIKDWRAMHSFSRLLPKNYFRCLLLSLMQNRKHPIWMEFWTDVEIKSAEYCTESKKALISLKLLSEKGIMRFGIRQKPGKITLNGRRIENFSIKNSRLSVEITESGIIEVVFD